jgi:hypothetical protein
LFIKSVICCIEYLQLAKNYRVGDLFYRLLFFMGSDALSMLMSTYRRLFKKLANVAAVQEQPLDRAFAGDGWPQSAYARPVSPG